MNPAYFKTIFLITDIPSQWPSNFAIITVWNPMDQKLSIKQNQSRDKELLLKFTKNNKFSPLIGSSPDYLHQEKSYIIEVSLQEAVQIGNDYDQRAVYYVENGSLQLIDCKTREKFSLGNFTDRIQFSDQKSR